jgi:predicted AlkP superfamily pyrophosphatase or phosphodiesterase
VDAALAAVNHYKLGSKKASDLLAISFSGHDFLGHLLGPNRREMEEITVAEDRSISRFLNGLNSAVPGGLKSVLIAFTGDHGIPPAPSYLAKKGVPSGYIDQEKLVQSLNQALSQQFKTESKTRWVRYVTNFNFYLDHSVISAAGVSTAEVERAVKKKLLSRPEFIYALTKAEHAAGILPPGLFGVQANHSYFPGRSGDVVAIARPFYIKAGTSKSSHLSGYVYDRMVPLILVGSHIKAGVYASRAEIVDLAPTLAFMLGVLPPALSEGRVLSEIFHH